MNQVDATISKMAECLDMIKPKLTATFGAPYERDYERIKQIGKCNQYVMWSGDIIGKGGFL